jgi:hypothetical protein
MAIKHVKVSGKADGADTALIQPSDWNGDHTLPVTGARLLGNSSATSAEVSELSIGSGLAFGSGSLDLDLKTVNGTALLGSGNVLVATTAQGSLADTAVQPSGLTSINTSITFLTTAVRVPTAATLTYSAGFLTGISETQTEGTKTTTLTYTTGVLTQIVAVLSNYTRTDTLTYTAGVLTSTTTSEVYS